MLWYWEKGGGRQHSSRASTREFKTRDTHRCKRLLRRTTRFLGTISRPIPVFGGVSLVSRAARSLPAKSNGIVLPPLVTLAGLGGWYSDRRRGGVEKVPVPVNAADAGEPDADDEEDVEERL